MDNAYGIFLTLTATHRVRLPTRSTSIFRDRTLAAQRSGLLFMRSTRKSRTFSVLWMWAVAFRLFVTLRMGTLAQTTLSKRIASGQHGLRRSGDAAFRQHDRCVQFCKQLHRRGTAYIGCDSDIKSGRGESDLDYIPRRNECVDGFHR